MGESAERGALTEAVFYILLSLYVPMHGYGIMQHIKALSGGRVSLGAGTLYGAINTLLQRGWISMVREDESGKKEYLITAAGKEAVGTETARLEELLTNAKKLAETGSEQ